MRWIPKILRRVIVLWCVFGMAKLCIMVNPYIQFIAKWIFPKDFARDPNNMTGLTWFLLILVAVAVVGLMLLAHCFTKWLFNEKD